MFGATTFVALAGFAWCATKSLQCSFTALRPFLVSHERTPFSWKIQQGRRAAAGHQGMALFLIGMKINRWWRVDLWWPVLLSMSDMLRELQGNGQSLGYYGGESYGLLALLLGYPSIQVTYWESVDKVLAFSKGETHSKAMQKYIYKMKGADAAVGVWHELYEISTVEGMHRDMPEFGLVRAVRSAPATQHLSSAEDRLRECSNRVNHNK